MMMGVKCQKKSIYKLDARFDDTIGIFDAIARHNFTKINGISDPVISSNIANFTNTNSYIVTNNLSDFTFGLNDFEISLDIKASGNTANYPSIFDLFRNTTYNDSQRLSMHLEGNTLKVAVYGFGGQVLILSTSSLSTTAFTKVSLRRNSGVLGLYFDDVLEGSSNINSNMDGLNNTVIIGGGGTSPSMVDVQNRYFIGQMRRFTISAS